MPNRLIRESSPYLLQHANNPVDWYPYGEEAFAEAQRRKCPVIISIGYSACHWCHVMEHESFSVPEIADVMNKLFVCIKVDREERPDVDQIYMNAVQLLHGQGGWPLNCFALPDGRPFWGGTYFRPDQWKETLLHLAQLFHDNIDDIVNQAARIHQGIKSMGSIPVPAASQPITNHTIQNIYDQLSLKFDTVQGGTRGAPKFPMPAIERFVLNYCYMSASDTAMNQLKLTLDKMWMGGIFDQLAGGFARYSTDAEWKVPHFEKMLYDNAQLAIVYAYASSLCDNGNYLLVMQHIMEFVQNELSSPEGAFYAALDADSEGEEGKFYVWKQNEIEELLPEYAALLMRYWGVGRQGLWEDDKNILLRPFTDDQFAHTEHLSAEELRQLVKMSSKILLQHRNKRQRPGLDDKIIASWNGLMTEAFAVAARMTGDEKFYSTALKAAQFIDNQMIAPDGHMNRTYKDGQAKINGFLDDYAFCAQAFIAIYQMTFDEYWLHRAKQLTDYVIEHFSQDDGILFWFLPSNNEDQNVISLSRVLETNDGVEPSGNAVMAWVLLLLGNYFEDTAYIDRSLNMCNRMMQNIETYPSWFAYWAMVSSAHAQGITTIAIAGPRALDLAKEAEQGFKPFCLLAAATTESNLPLFKYKFVTGKTFVYKCANFTCSAPVENIVNVGC